MKKVNKKEKIKNLRFQTATFGAGCFWHVQLEFSKIPGVIETSAGYMGGIPKFANPTYEEVCSDKTGHAEVVQIKFDPKIVSFKNLLEIFWKNHDPTQLNRQGPDTGTQYRSVIFYHSEKQKKESQESLKELQKILSKRIMTEIVPAKAFYRAEEYHQNYLEKKGLTSCTI